MKASAIVDLWNERIDKLMADLNGLGWLRDVRVFLMDCNESLRPDSGC